jgi:hypothetical protein
LVTIKKISTQTILKEILLYTKEMASLGAPQLRRSCSAPCTSSKSNACLTSKFLDDLKLTLKELVIDVKARSSSTVDVSTTTVTEECDWTSPTAPPLPPPTLDNTPEVTEKEKETLVISPSLQAAIDAIVNETEVITPPPPTTATCSVCLEPCACCVYSCMSDGCSGAMCLECTKDCVQNTIESSKYAVPAIRCPGRCFSNITNGLWRGLLNDKFPQLTHELMERYEENASTLLSLRCGSCDETANFSLKQTLVYREAEDRVKATHDVLNLVAGGQKQTDEEALMKLLTSWANFLSGKVEAKEMAMLLINHLHDGSRFIDEGEDVLSSDLDSFLHKSVLPLILDLERRTSLHMAILRLRPKFYTICCCYYCHCFTCKVDGWHEGSTCEEQQQEELGIVAQYCPGCDIPTIRTDGCEDMLCVCGQYWSWDGEDNDESDY